jgi:hypothetical protein
MPGNVINIIFDIIRFKYFFSAGVLFEIGTLQGGKIRE